MDVVAAGAGGGRNVAAGANPMSLKKGIEKAVGNHSPGIVFKAPDSSSAGSDNNGAVFWIESHP